MIYLKPNQTNTIVVTWSQRQLQASGNFRWVMTHIETLQVVVVNIPKATNTSPAVERYDRFTITSPFARLGQYSYVVYDNDGSDDIAVVDSGLAQVEMAEQAYAATDNVITYKTPNENIFDFTFDLTFN